MSRLILTFGWLVFMGYLMFNLSKAPIFVKMLMMI